MSEHEHAESSTRVPLTPLQLAAIRREATARAWDRHISTCDSVQQHSQPCETCWDLDRIADEAVYEHLRQRHLARRARLTLVTA